MMQRSRCSTVAVAVYACVSNNKYVNDIMAVNFVPGWYKVWLCISSLLVVWDTLYVLYRPHTMKGGPYSSYFFPYETYITIDTLYGNLTDSFVVIQSKCNIVEILMVALSLVVGAGAGNKASHRRKSAGALLCLIASCFTFWKTVIYVLYGYPHLSFARGNELTIVGAFILPTACWLVFPLLGIFAIGDRLINAIERNAAQKQE